MVQVVQQIGDFAIGDIVNVKSGGPELIITGFRAPEPQPAFVGAAPAGVLLGEASPEALCSWFNSVSGMLQTAAFPVNALAVKTKASGAPPAPPPKIPASA